MSATERTRICSACGGHGTAYVGPSDVACSACGGSGWVDDDSTDPTNDADEYEAQLVARIRERAASPSSEFLTADRLLALLPETPYCPLCGCQTPQFGCSDPFHLPDKEK